MESSVVSYGMEVAYRRMRKLSVVITTKEKRYGYAVGYKGREGPQKSARCLGKACE